MPTKRTSRYSNPTINFDVLNPFAPKNFKNWSYNDSYIYTANDKLEAMELCAIILRKIQYNDFFGFRINGKKITLNSSTRLKSLATVAEKCGFPSFQLTEISQSTSSASAASDFEKASPLTSTSAPTPAAKAAVAAPSPSGLAGQKRGRGARIDDVKAVRATSHLSSAPSPAAKAAFAARARTGPAVQKRDSGGKFAAATAAVAAPATSISAGQKRVRDDATIEDMRVVFGPSHLSSGASAAATAAVASAPSGLAGQKRVRDDATIEDMRVVFGPSHLSSGASAAATAAVAAPATSISAGQKRVRGDATIEDMRVVFGPSHLSSGASVAATAAETLTTNEARAQLSPARVLNSGDSHSGSDKFSSDNRESIASPPSVISAHDAHEEYQEGINSLPPIDFEDFETNNNTQISPPPSNDKVRRDSVCSLLILDKSQSSTDSDLRLNRSSLDKEITRTTAPSSIPSYVEFFADSGKPSGRGL